MAATVAYILSSRAAALTYHHTLGSQRLLSSFSCFCALRCCRLLSRSGLVSGGICFHPASAVRWSAFPVNCVSHFPPVPDFLPYPVCHFWWLFYIFFEMIFQENVKHNRSFSRVFALTYIHTTNVIWRVLIKIYMVFTAHVVCPSVCLSVTLVICGHIGWKSWKLTARTISRTPSLFVAKRRSTYSKGNMGKFWGDWR